MASGSAVPLREIGLPQKDVPLALLTFNLGVEAGQLVFVAIALLANGQHEVVARFRLLTPAVLARLSDGTLSAFWFVQRVETTPEWFTTEFAA